MVKKYFGLLAFEAFYAPRRDIAKVDLAVSAYFYNLSRFVLA